MSEDAEKRFDATPSRKARARREGNSARSSELSVVAAFGAGLAALSATLPAIGDAAAHAIRATAQRGVVADPHDALAVVAWACVTAAAAAAASVAVTFVQTGGLRVAPVRFALASLAPQRGLKRIFGGEGIVAAVRASIALVATLAAATVTATGIFAIALRPATPLAAASAARDGAFTAATAACIVGALFAAADYAVVLRRWLRSLRMSFDEFKRDLKEQDGDPHARSRRRQLHRSLSRSDVRRTREASFVVVNPTHVAVALRYAPPTIPVPEILVRAVDDAALAVRAIAEREAIPVVPDVALARWLLRVGEPGRPIPEETFVAVAEVIGALIRAGVFAP